MTDFLNDFYDFVKELVGIKKNNNDEEIKDNNMWVKSVEDNDETTDIVNENEEEKSKDNRNAVEMRAIAKKNKEYIDEYFKEYGMYEYYFGYDMLTEICSNYKIRAYVEANGIIYLRRNDIFLKTVYEYIKKELTNRGFKICYDNLFGEITAIKWSEE